MQKQRKIVLELLAAGVLSLVLWLQFGNSNELSGGIETSNYFSLLLSAVITAPFVLLFAFIGRKNWSFKTADLLIVGFFAYIVVHSFITDSLGGREFYFTCSYFVIYLCFRMTVHLKITNYCLIVILLAGLYQSVIVLSQLWGFDSSNHNRFIVTGTFYNPGPCGIFLSAVLVLAATIVKKGCRAIAFSFWYIRYVLAYVTLIVSLVAVVPTMSRAGWIGAAVAIALLYRKEIIGIVKRVKYKAVVWIGAACLIVLLSGIYLMKKDSANGRLFMWQNGISAFFEAPLFGSGIDCFGEVYGNAQHDYFFEREALVKENKNSVVAGVPSSVFNEFISLAMILGIVGVLFVIFIFIVKFRRLSTFSYITVAILVSSLFSYTFYIPLIAVPFLFALANLPNGRNRRIGLWWMIPVLGLFAVIFCVSEYRRKEAYKEWKSSSIYYSVKDYESVCEDYVKLYPQLKNDYKFLFEYGQSLNKIKKYEESNTILSEGTKKSCDPMFWNIIGNNYLETGDYINSEKAYLRAFYLCPNRHYSLYLLTKLHAKTGDVAKQDFYGNILLKKKPKVESMAIKEMQQETEEILKNN